MTPCEFWQQGQTRQRWISHPGQSGRLAFALQMTSNFFMNFFFQSGNVFSMVISLDLYKVYARMEDCDWTIGG